MFNLLFRSAWSSLQQTIEAEQQFALAAAMVLHTWSQHLDTHIHVHASVSIGGPRLMKPAEWKANRPPARQNQRRERISRLH